MSNAPNLYQALMAPFGAEGDLWFLRHVLASILTIAAQDPDHTLAQGCGLSPNDLRSLQSALFPATPLDYGTADGSVPENVEEPDLVQMLLNGATPGAEATHVHWLAPMIARRAQRPNHLWQDLGLPERAHLTRLMRDYFAPIAAKNDRDMKWKKFFYREMCAEEGFSLCKSPVCDTCDDFNACFDGEDGHALLAHIARGE